jgi:hypothetical protein
VSRAVLFLDIDDVVCLNRPYGGYDVALALSPQSRGKHTAPLGLWSELFDSTACAHLRRINEEFRPVYVISSSWTRVLDHAKLREALSRGGLQFVVDNLHREMVTPTIRGRTNRWAEICLSLQSHPEFASRWVILDDELSGTGLDLEQPIENLPFIVMCRENVGLTEVEYVKLRAAFQLRSKGRQATQ